MADPAQLSHGEMTQNLHIFIALPSLSREDLGKSLESNQMYTVCINLSATVKVIFDILKRNKIVFYICKPCS